MISSFTFGVNCASFFPLPFILRRPSSFPR